MKVVVSDHCELHSFQATWPCPHSMNHSKQVLLTRRVITLCRGQHLTLKGYWPALLSQGGTYAGD